MEQQAEDWLKAAQMANKYAPVQQPSWTNTSGVYYAAPVAGSTSYSANTLITTT